jgi:predicted phosphohydrolase
MKLNNINFQIISDIHLEKKKYNNNILYHPIKADNLILAGDIGNPLKYNYKDYLKFCSNNYKRIFLISGNHEYWHNTIEDTDNLIKQICSSFNNVFYLNNNFFEFEENFRKVKLFGGIMWSYVNNSNIYSTDNILIKNFNFHKRNSIFINTLNNILSKNVDIIITHHAPSYYIIDNKYKGFHNNSLFANNLDFLLNKNTYWICGHLHEYNNLHKYNNLIINCCHDNYEEKIINLD